MVTWTTATAVIQLSQIATRSLQVQTLIAASVNYITVLFHLKVKTHLQMYVLFFVRFNVLRTVVLHILSIVLCLSCDIPHLFFTSMSYIRRSSLQCFYISVYVSSYLWSSASYNCHIPHDKRTDVRWLK